MAQRHWERWLPEQYAAVEDPGAFVTALGEEAARQVDDLAAQLAGDGGPGEGYVERAGRLASARARAEEIVLQQRVLPAPEAFADDEEGVQLEGRVRPLAVDPGHPSWAAVDAEQRERAGQPLRGQIAAGGRGHTEFKEAGPPAQSRSTADSRSAGSV